MEMSFCCIVGERELVRTYEKITSLWHTIIYAFLPPSLQPKLLDTQLMIWLHQVDNLLGFERLSNL